MNRSSVQLVHTKPVNPLFHQRPINGGSKGAAPLLLFDQTEARRAENSFLETARPPSKGRDDPSPLLKGLDPLLLIMRFQNALIRVDRA